MSQSKNMKQQRFWNAKDGNSYIFATGLGLVLSLLMVGWIAVIILTKGLGFFWPRDIVQVETLSNQAYLGETWESDIETVLDSDGQPEKIQRLQLKIGNRDLYGLDFKWLDEKDIQNITKPEDAVVIERNEYGNFYGFIESLTIGDETYPATAEGFQQRLQEVHEKALQLYEEIHKLELKLAKLAEPLNRLHKEINLLSYRESQLSDKDKAKLAKLREEAAKLESDIADEYQQLTEELIELKTREQNIFVGLKTVDGRTKNLQLSHVVRFFYPNKMNVVEKTGHYLAKLWEFVSANPRESNTEGGVFPAIFGTVLMVILMSIAVVPFGVMAAIYLNEYAKQGPVTRLIRLSVNNLAGVPSIVYGVFGLGFFVYFVGGSIDQLFFSDKLPEPTFGTGGILWASLTLALLTLPVVVVATEEGLLAVPRANKEGALALGATKWQMIRKVVLPNAMPGILTGLILAISRGAGEVAPLMITGVVKLAPSLPLDWSFPFLHLDRKFMHLGFHIYDVGFQSPNVEAAKPMVYTTALLLILIVVFLNMIAIYIRNQLRKKYKTSTF
jgi:phosphate transport system permease protein